MNQSILQHLYNQLHYQFSQLISKRESEKSYVNECKKFMKLQSVQNTTSTSLLSREIHCTLERILAFEE